MLLRWIAAGTVACVASLSASEALADCTITITPGSVSLGKIVPNTTVNGVQNAGQATTFTIPVAGGPVTQSPTAGGAGVAILLHPPSSVQWQLNITSGPSCSGSTTVRLQGTSTGTPGVTIGGFTISSGNPGTVVSPASVANNGVFNLTFPQSGNNRLSIVNVGTSITLPAHSASGAASWTTKATVPST